MSLPQGIHDIPAELYHADPCVSSSLSNSVARILMGHSPRHAWLAHPRLNPKYCPSEDSRFDLGTAAHALLLEGSSAKVCVIDADDWRAKAAREQRDRARNDGMTPILAKHNIALTQMVSEAHEFIDKTELAGIFSRGKSEQTIIWQEDGGVWCRSRLDLLADDHSLILDYKTAANAEPAHFSDRVIRQMGYAFQGGFYRRGLMAVDAGCDPEFFILAQDIEAPYCCSLHRLSDARKELADFDVQRAIDLWRKCMKSNDWPAYSTQTHISEPTEWEVSVAEMNGFEGLYEETMR
jgi:hypothetical protein